MKHTPADKIKLVLKMLANPTKWERLLYWQLAINRVYFKKQCIIKGYIVDAYLPREKIAIECDGRQHRRNYEYDEILDMALKRIGIKTIRILNHQISDDPEGFIKRMIKENGIFSIRDAVNGVVRPDCGQLSNRMQFRRNAAVIDPQQNRPAYLPAATTRTTRQSGQNRSGASLSNS